MPIINTERKSIGIQYDGTNIAEIAAVVDGFYADHPQDWTNTATHGTPTDFRMNFLYQGVIEFYDVRPVGEWIVIDQNNSNFNYSTDSQFAYRFRKPVEVLAGLTAIPEFSAAVTSSTARSFINNASRSLTTGTGATGFQVSASRDALVGYNVTMSTTATIGGASTVTVVLEICPTNSATPAAWVEIARISNSQTITLAVVLQSIQGVAAKLSGVIPAGYYAKLRTVTTGTASALYNTGQEVLL